MAKYEHKTKVNNADVKEFLESVDNQQRREDALRVLDIMKECTGETAKMWGKSIVGFGTYDYKYASGQEGTWMATGFSPRKQALTLYVMAGFPKFADLMEKLGPHKTGKSCLYIKNLDDVDEEILRQIITTSYKYTIENNKGC